MAYALRSGLTYAWLGSDIVFLDTVADRYFSLPSSAAVAFRTMIEGDGPSSDLSPLAKQLLDRNILVPSAVTASMTTADEANEDVCSWQDGAVPPASILYACAAIILQRWKLQTRTLDHVLHRFSAAKVVDRDPASNDPKRQQRLVAAFAQARFWVPSHDRCLSNSLALAIALIRSGIDADLIFGVALKPFAAHCWVQSHHRVLNDSLDHIRTFTPILAL